MGASRHTFEAVDGALRHRIETRAGDAGELRPMLDATYARGRPVTEG